MSSGQCCTKDNFCAHRLDFKKLEGTLPMEDNLEAIPAQPRQKRCFQLLKLHAKSLAKTMCRFKR